MKMIRNWRLVGKILSGDMRGISAYVNQRKGLEKKKWGELERLWFLRTWLKFYFVLYKCKGNIGILKFH